MIRTISMLPAATEMVGALGLLHQLVGVSHECDYPADVDVKPRVTFCEIYGKGFTSAEIDRWVSERLRAGESLYALDEPLLRDLAPDLILTQRLCDVCAPDFGSVAALAASLPTKPRVLNLEPKSLGDVFQNIRQVADAMGHADRAEAVVKGLEQRVAEVVKAVAGRGQPTVFVMEWADPIFNAGHWTPQLVSLAGGVPVLSAAGEDSIRIPWADLRAADPEVLVIACCGHSVERTRQDVPLLEALPGWRDLRVVRTGRVYLADGSAYFSRPGPRLVDTLEILAAMIHPVSLKDHSPAS